MNDTLAHSVDSHVLVKDYALSIAVVAAFAFAAMVAVGFSPRIAALRQPDIVQSGARPELANSLPPEQARLLQVSQLCPVAIQNRDEIMAAATDADTPLPQMDQNNDCVKTYQAQVSQAVGTDTTAGDASTTPSTN